MNPKRRTAYSLLFIMLVLGYFSFESWGVEPEPLEGRITQINEKKGTITINGLALDASDFELSDLKVGYWVMGEFIRENGKLRLIDLEVIR